MDYFVNLELTFPKLNPVFKTAQEVLRRKVP